MANLVFLFQMAFELVVGFGAIIAMIALVVQCVFTAVELLTNDAEILPMPHNLIRPTSPCNAQMDALRAA